MRSFGCVGDIQSNDFLLYKAKQTITMIRIIISIAFLYSIQMLSAKTISSNITQVNSETMELLVLDSIAIDRTSVHSDVILDTITHQDENSMQQMRFSYKQLIIPSALIAYGIFETAIEHNYLLNRQVKHEVTEHIDSKFTIDDISQYVPAGSVYALNLMGIKGKNNFKDRTFILGLSTLFMAASVNTIKYSAKIERPDKSAKNSFPSGHTAVAFMGAEFLWQEYKDVSIWYGITGYTIATGTGLFRLYNDKHWFADVIVGAGLGILSAKAAYWLYPYLQRRFMSKGAISKQVSFSPFYNGKQGGLSLSLHL